MKNYIRDNNKVRLCDSNIAKMNIFEVMYYYRYTMIEDILSLISKIKELIIPILILLLFPISYLILAYIRIYQAKKEVKRCNK